MTPKEKAHEIVNELFERSLCYHDACIAGKYLVEKVLEAGKQPIVSEYFDDMYWNEVQKEMSEIKI